MSQVNFFFVPRHPLIILDCPAFCLLSNIGSKFSFLLSAQSLRAINIVITNYVSPRRAEINNSELRYH